MVLVMAASSRPDAAIVIPMPSSASHKFPMAPIAVVSSALIIRVTLPATTLDASLAISSEAAASSAPART